MSVKIRMRRTGSNKQPFFRVVVTDVRRSNRGTFLENVGWYDPKKKGENFSIDMDRIRYWTERGAQLSPQGVNRLADAGLRIGVMPQVPAVHRTGLDAPGNLVN